MAGFYAGHRRSDDLDLFTADESHQRSAALAVKSLETIGAELAIGNESAQYLEGVGKLEGHLFKLTVVSDPNLFRVGKSVQLKGHVEVADLETLFRMKAATLVSRCSEKDLYDLIWLFGHFQRYTFADLLRLGAEIDGGVTGEAVLSSVAGAILRKDACDFSLDPKLTAEEVFGNIKEFRKRLLQGISEHLEQEPSPPLGELVRKLERIARR